MNTGGADMMHAAQTLTWWSERNMCPVISAETAAQIVFDDNSYIEYGMHGGHAGVLIAYTPDGVEEAHW